MVIYSLYSFKEISLFIKFLEASCVLPTPVISPRVTICKSGAGRGVVEGEGVLPAAAPESPERPAWSPQPTPAGTTASGKANWFQILAHTGSD